MAGVSTHKLALLYLMKILLEETDEDHALNATAIIDRLRAYDCEIDRRSIYADVEALEQFGLDINIQGGNAGGYYIGSRDFELPELKLLVDAVQSSKFITVKKTDALIEKLSSLTSKSLSKTLHREVFVRNRIKADNETIYYIIDGIYEAMDKDRQITYQYAEWTRDKKLIPKKNGELYRVSPWAMTWDDENYYLIAYDDAAGKIKHYRVDKMMQIAVTDQKRVGGEEFKNFDLAVFAKKTFGMYGGHDENVKLRCPNYLAGVVLDRFGHDLMMIPDGDTHFRTTVTVAVSPQFFGWAAGIGPEMEIAGPQNVREEYRDYLKEILTRY